MLSLIGTDIEVVKGEKQIIDHHDDSTEVFHAITVHLLDVQEKAPPIAMQIHRVDGSVVVHNDLESMRAEAKKWNWNHGFFSNGIREIHLIYYTYTEIYDPVTYREDHVEGLVTI